MTLCQKSSFDKTILAPTWKGFLYTTFDALIILEACLLNKLACISTRLHETKRFRHVLSGNVFVYTEQESGIKRWTDGGTWSPSRVMGNFLVYRELSRPFPRGTKRKATKSKHDENSTCDASYSIFPLEEKCLVGSLIDSYGYKPGGLLKKTFSVRYQGIDDHIVSYFSVEDVKRGTYSRPKLDPSLQDIHPRPDLLRGPFRSAPFDPCNDPQSTISAMETTDALAKESLLQTDSNQSSAAYSSTNYSSFIQNSRLPNHSPIFPVYCEDDTENDTPRTIVSNLILYVKDFHALLQAPKKWQSSDSIVAINSPSSQATYIAAPLSASQPYKMVATQSDCTFWHSSNTSHQRRVYPTARPILPECYEDVYTSSMITHSNLLTSNISTAGFTAASKRPEIINYAETTSDCAALSNKTQRQPRKPEQRKTHNKIQRKYRDSVNAALKGLRSVLPGICPTDNSLPHGRNYTTKVAVFIRATAYIKQLEQQTGQLLMENEDLRAGAVNSNLFTIQCML